MPLDKNLLAIKPGDKVIIAKDNRKRIGDVVSVTRTRIRTRDGREFMRENGRPYPSSDVYPWLRGIATDAEVKQIQEAEAAKQEKDRKEQKARQDHQDFKNKLAGLFPVNLRPSVHDAGPLGSFELSFNQLTESEIREIATAIRRQRS